MLNVLFLLLRRGVSAVLANEIVDELIRLNVPDCAGLLGGMMVKYPSKINFRLGSAICTVDPSSPLIRHERSSSFINSSASFFSFSKQRNNLSISVRKSWICGISRSFGSRHSANDYYRKI